MGSCWGHVRAAQSRQLLPTHRGHGQPCTPPSTARAVTQRLQNDSARIRPGQPGFPDSASPAATGAGGSNPTLHQHRHRNTLRGGAGDSPQPCDPPGSTRTLSSTGDDGVSSYSKALGSAGSAPATLGRPCLRGGIRSPASGQPGASGRDGCGARSPAHPGSLALLPVVFFLGETQENRSPSARMLWGLHHFPPVG